MKPTADPAIMKGETMSPYVIGYDKPNDASLPDSIPVVGTPKDPTQKPAKVKVRRIGVVVTEDATIADAAKKDKRLKVATNTLPITAPVQAHAFSLGRDIAIEQMRRTGTGPVPLPKKEKEETPPAVS